MEIHTVFMPLLICIGILGVTDAQDNSFDPNNALKNAVPEAEAESEDHNHIMRLLFEMWDKEGASLSFMSFIDVNMMEHCMPLLLESTNITYFDMIKNLEKPRLLIEPLCPRFSILVSCANEFKKDNPRPEYPELEIYDEYRDRIFSLIKYGCENNGEIWNSLIDGDGAECLNETSMERKICYILREEAQIKRPSNSELQKLPSSLQEQEDCAQLEMFCRCQLYFLQRCSKPEATNVIKDLLNEMLVFSRCKNPANQQSSPVS